MSVVLCSEEYEFHLLDAITAEDSALYSIDVRKFDDVFVVPKSLAMLIKHKKIIRTTIRRTAVWPHLNLPRNLQFMYTFPQ